MDEQDRYSLTEVGAMMGDQKEPDKDVRAAEMAVFIQQAAKLAVNAIAPVAVQAKTAGEAFRIMAAGAGAIIFAIHEMMCAAGKNDQQAIDFIFPKLRGAHEAGVAGVRRSEEKTG